MLRTKLRLKASDMDCRTDQLACASRRLSGRSPFHRGRQIVVRYPTRDLVHRKAHTRSSTRKTKSSSTPFKAIISTFSGLPELSDQHRSDKRIKRDVSKYDCHWQVRRTTGSQTSMATADCDSTREFCIERPGLLYFELLPNAVQQECLLLSRGLMEVRPNGLFRNLEIICHGTKTMYQETLYSERQVTLSSTSSILSRSTKIVTSLLTQYRPCVGIIHKVIKRQTWRHTLANDGERSTSLQNNRRIAKI